MTRQMLGIGPRVVRTAVETAFRLLPHGGEHVAIRNAWAAMAADTARSRERRSVDAFLAALASGHPAAGAPARLDLPDDAYVGHA